MMLLRQNFLYLRRKSFVRKLPPSVKHERASEYKYYTAMYNVPIIRVYLYTYTYEVYLLETEIQI